MNNQNIMFGLYPPMEKLEKSKNVKQYILMNVERKYWYAPFYIGYIIYLAKMLISLLSNKIFFDFWNQSIIQ